MADITRRVRLNVGGRIFETTVGTLTPQPCFFTGLFSGNFRDTE
jgi:hypothetical protein